MESYLGIKINRELDSLLSEQAIKLLEEYYLRKYETSPQQAFARAAVAYCEGDFAFAQRIYDYASTKKFMFSSPILSNAPYPGETIKALPISCFLSYVPDNLEGLIDHTTELRWLSVKGGGVGGHWGDVRSVSDKAPGPIPFLHTVDADMTAYRQGKTRKGSYAAYMDISHPDIVEFINMRVPTGDLNRKNHNLFNAVNVTDAFMKKVEEGCCEDPKCEKDHDCESAGMFELIDPHDGSVRDTIPARKLWEQILITRSRTGIPYINFIDAANRALPEEMKKAGMKIKGSNLCNEIHLPTDKDKTAVCCLCSLNLEHYREWGDGQIVRDLVRMLDNVLNFFIKHTQTESMLMAILKFFGLSKPGVLDKACKGAKDDRPLGLGVMGEHSLFQKEGIPFESKEAYQLDEEIFTRIKTEALKETYRLGKERGECPSMRGSGKRNSHLLAVAPNANSSIILGCSPSIEPFKANAFTHRTRVGSHLIKNKYLEKELELLDKNTQDIWSSIIVNGGSVQHLEIPNRLKEIYKTAVEIDQHKIVELAANRQRFICQGQSVNLFFPAGAATKYVQTTHFKMWKLGGKGLYYYRTEATQRAEIVAKRVQNKKRENNPPNSPVNAKELKERLENLKNLERERENEEFQQQIQEDEQCLSCQG